jgi:CDP-diglyceride synthetase
MVAQLVRAPDCGSGGRGFDPHSSPISNNKTLEMSVFFIILLYLFTLFIVLYITHHELRNYWSTYCKNAYSAN